MSGLWVSPNYNHAPTTADDLLVVTAICGFTLGCALFSASKAFEQTKAIWKRSRRITSYPVLIWAEWLSSLIISLLAWLHIKGIIMPR